MKSLEALKELKGVLAYFGAHTEKAIESCNTIEKELKALEVIKKHNVLITQIIEFDNLEDFNELQIDISEKLTQEEYELLKEVLL